MAEAPPAFVLRRRRDALRSVDGHPNFQRLTAEALTRIGFPDALAAWQVDVDDDGEFATRTFLVVADHSFPYRRPTIYLMNAPKILTWPHLEERGHLCLLGGGVPSSIDEPLNVVLQLLERARTLVNESLSGTNEEDFRTEFQDYWRRKVDPNAMRYVSLLDPAGPSREVVVRRGERSYTVAENQRVLARWWERRHGRHTKLRGNFDSEALLLWLPQPLTPSEFPSMLSEMADLAHQLEDGARALFDAFLDKQPTRLTILLGAAGRNGVSFGALSIFPDKQAGLLPAPGAQHVRGFRPGKEPSMLTPRKVYSPRAEVRKATVDRADHFWVHGRDADPEQSDLRQRHVAVIGCGSLGAGVAVNLAGAGVGRFTLIDQGVLAYENLSRHVLGAGEEGALKAKALASRLKKNFPHLGDIDAFPISVGPASSGIIELLANADVIVSATADWPAETFLNDAQQCGEIFAAIVHAWLEPRAVAAHAVVTRSGSPCLACGVDKNGRRKSSVCEWPNGEESIALPGCGGTFSPYGSVLLGHAHSLVTSMVLDQIRGITGRLTHRTFIARIEEVRKAGAQWSQDWIAQRGDPYEGGCEVRSTWGDSAECPHCGSRAAAA